MTSPHYYHIIFAFIPTGRAVDNIFTERLNRSLKVAIKHTLKKTEKNFGNGAHPSPFIISHSKAFGIKLY